jgi:hypothetical protein
VSEAATAGLTALAPPGGSTRWISPSVSAVSDPGSVSSSGPSAAWASGPPAGASGNEAPEHDLLILVEERRLDAVTGHAITGDRHDVCQVRVAGEYVSPSAPPSVAWADPADIDTTPPRHRRPGPPSSTPPTR